MKVHEFPQAPALQEDTKIPVAQLGDQAAPANLFTTPWQIAEFLVADGFQKEAILRNATEIGMVDPDGKFAGENVEEVLMELLAMIEAIPEPGEEATLSGVDIVTLLSDLPDEQKLPLSAIRGGDAGAGGGEGASSSSWTRAALAATGLTGSIEYIGAAPSLGGNQGNYTLTVPAGCTWKRMRLKAVSSSGATSGNAIQVSVTRADGEMDVAGVIIFDDGASGQIIASGTKGIIPSVSVPAGGVVSTNILNIGAQTSAFTLVFP